MISPATATGPPTFEFKAPRQPMLWTAVTYAIGILAGTYAWRPAVWWLVAAVMFVAAAAYFASRRPGLGWFLGFATFFLAGALHIQLRNASPRLDTSVLPYADHREVTVTAHIKAEGRIQRGGMGELQQTLDVESEQLQTADGESVPVHSGLRLNIYSPWDEESLAPPDIASYKPTLHYGDRIRFVTKLRP